MLQLLLLALVAFAAADIWTCPTNDPCIGCNPSCPYICVTVPPGNHDPDFSDSLALYSHGYKGFTSDSTLQYRIVFHNSTLTYGCSNATLNWCSNVNKLFGFSRGLVQVMDKSCIFGWHKGIQANDTGKIAIYGYGWYNESMKPWETLGQMPYMTALESRSEYVFVLTKYETNCTYTVYDTNGPDVGNTIAVATTPQGPLVDGSLSYFFNSFFGGTEAALDEVTISYSNDVNCTSTAPHNKITPVLKV